MYIRVLIFVRFCNYRGDGHIRIYPKPEHSRYLQLNRFVSVRLFGVGLLYSIGYYYYLSKQTLNMLLIISKVATGSLVRPDSRRHKN